MPLTWGELTPSEQVQKEAGSSQVSRAGGAAVRESKRRVVGTVATEARAGPNSPSAITRPGGHKATEGMSLGGSGDVLWWQSEW
jgi:hypothetical protein